MHKNLQIHLEAIETKAAREQERDERGRFGSGSGGGSSDSGSFQPATGADDAPPGSTVRMKGPLNLGTGSGPRVTHEIRIDSHEKTRMGTVLVGTVTSINGQSPDEFMSKDPVYSKATDAQKDRLVNSVRVHGSQLPANKATVKKV